MKRVLCIWFPQWPLQRIYLVQPELKGNPVVLYSATRRDGSRRRGEWQVVHCSREAVAGGVRPGIPLAEAQALLERVRGAHFAEHDCRRDADLLQQIAGWCSRYSPLVGFEEAEQPSSLFLDVTGCDHLFGGEEALVRRVAWDFERVGYHLRAALAETPGAAWAVAHYASFLETAQRPPSPARTPAAPAALIVPPGRQAAWVAPLPIAGLRLPENVIEMLRELGIEQIGQLQKLPRSTLPARFGSCVLDRLDQALGRIDELIVPVPPPDPITASWSFEDPTTDLAALQSVMRTLVDDVARKLANRQEGAQRLACRFLYAHAPSLCLTIGAVHPTAAADHLQELLQLQLERLSLAGEVLSVELEVLTAGPLEIRQSELFDSGTGRAAENQLTVLLDRLSNRLGEAAVLRPRLQPDPQPEYACRLVSAVEVSAPNGSAMAVKGGAHRAGEEVEPVVDYPLISGSGVRPLCLKPRPIPIEAASVIPDGPPIRFRLGNEDHVVRKYWGPERIETAWWRAAAVERDYYRVETTVGARFWLFRQRNNNRWYLHGEFA